MAKRKVNKTQAVKDFLAENPDAATNDVVAAMKAKGIVVSANYVSTIKSSVKGKGKGKKKVAAKKKGAPKKQEATDDKILLSALKEAKKLAERLGGIEEAKQAISALAQLTD